MVSGCPVCAFAMTIPLLGDFGLSSFTQLARWYYHHFWKKVTTYYGHIRVDYDRDTMDNVAALSFRSYQDFEICNKYIDVKPGETATSSDAMFTVMIKTTSNRRLDVGEQHRDARWRSCNEVCRFKHQLSVARVWNIFKFRWRRRWGSIHKSCRCSRPVKLWYF